MQSRSQRRHHQFRMRQRAIEISRFSWGRATEFAIKNANNLAVCSRPCCGNPRRHFHRKTFPELRFEKDAKDAKDEIGRAVVHVG